jgi:5-hydroxyisourate hydrolase-like protein (transthyretin family)
LVTAEGAPISGSEIEVVFDPNSADRLPMVKTDADGRFREELPSGGPFELYAHPFPFAFFAKKLSVDVGERVDLGEITIDRDQKNRPFQPKINRGPEKRTKPPAAAQASTVPAPASTPRPMLRGDVAKGGPATIIHGTVLRPDGKPATDATISLYGLHWSSGDKVQWERFASTGPNAHGDFELASPPSEWPGADGVLFFATARGLGCDFRSSWLLKPPKPLVMQLVPDQPIRGRVLDLEGKPVAGARVHVVTITDSLKRSLGPWLDAMKSGVPRYSSGAHALLGNMMTRIPGGGGAASTDRDGRFILQGLGAERLVDLALESDATAYRQVTVATRNMPPIVRASAPGDGGLEILGAEFTTSAKPTRPIIGTVRDAMSGKPMEGVEIQSWRLAGERFAGQRGLRTTSDAQGKYRLVGLPKGKGNELFIVPNDDQPYFMRRFEVPDFPGIDPVTVDVELHRGLWITGRVTDKDTGQPVRAVVHYWPFLDNPHPKSLPEFGPGRNMTGDQFRWPTRPDGTFRIPGLPGRGLVGAEARLVGYREGAGAAEIHDADHEGRLRTYRDQVWPSLKSPTTMKEINPAEETQTVVCDLVCDHGETIRITVLDPEGKPARHCSLSKPTKDGKLNDIDSPFDLNGLALHIKQPLLVQQKERNLAKYVTYTLTEQSPRVLTVKLEPCATVVGRLLDEDGFPLKGVTLEPQFRRSGDFWVRLPSVVCKGDGSFEYRGLPTGASFTFSLQEPGMQILRRFGPVEPEPGKTVNVGDLKLKQRGVADTDYIELRKSEPESKTRRVPGIKALSMPVRASRTGIKMDDATRKDSPTTAQGMDRRARSME